MIDLEREVKELLERRAEEAADVAPNHMPDRIRDRARRRQTRTVVMAGLLIGVVGLAVFAGMRPLLRPPSSEPGTEHDGSPAPPLFTEPSRQVVASGQVGGDRWSLTAGRSEELWCVGMETYLGDTRWVGSSCAHDLLQGRHLVANAESRPNFDVVLVSGAVSHQVDRVLFDRDTGADVEGTIYPLPKREDGPFNVFVIPLPKDRPVGGVVLAFDSKGDLLGQHGVYPESVLAIGHFRGHPWTLLHNRQHGCLEALSAGTRYPMCNARVPDRRFFDWTTLGSPAERENLLFGFIHADARQLIVEVAGSGSAEGRVFPLPWDAEAKAFFVYIDGHQGELVAIDAIGDEIRRERFRLIPFSEG